MSGEELRATKVSSVALAKETLVVKRLVYKNTSQHRRDRNFQKLRRVSEGVGVVHCMLSVVAILAAMTALKGPGAPTRGAAVRPTEETVVESI